MSGCLTKEEQKKTPNAASESRQITNREKIKTCESGSQMGKQKEKIYIEKEQNKLSAGGGIIRRMLLKTEHTRHNRSVNDHECTDLGNAARTPVRTLIRGSPLLQV